MAGFFSGTDIGGTILQIAQSVQAQRMQQQRMAMELEKFEQEVDQQEKNFKLREQELDLRTKVQEQQMQLAMAQEGRAAAMFPTQLAQGSADLALTRAKTNATVAGGGAQARGLTANAKAEIYEKINEGAIELEMTQFFANYNQTAEQPVQLFSSPEAALKRRRELQADIADFQTSTSAQEALLIQQKRDPNAVSQVDVMQGELSALNALVDSPMFKDFTQRLALDGPSPKSRQAFAQERYGDLMGQLQFNRESGPVAPKMDYQEGTSQRQADNAWDMLKDGHSESLFDILPEVKDAGLLQAQFEKAYPKDSTDPAVRATALQALKTAVQRKYSSR